MTNSALSSLPLNPEAAGEGWGSRLGNRDPLTGLLCRSSFEIDRLNPALMDQVAAVILIDFDGFSRVNQDYGRDIGDFVLAMSADRFSSVNLPFDRLNYRYEGDHFVSLLLGDASRFSWGARTVLATIQGELQREIHLSGFDLRLSCTLSAAVKDKAVPVTQTLTDLLLYSDGLKHRGQGQLHILADQTEESLKAC